METFSDIIDSPKSYDAVPNDEAMIGEVPLHIGSSVMVV